MQIKKIKLTPSKFGATTAFASESVLGASHLKRNVAARAPAICALLNLYPKQGFARATDVAPRTLCARTPPGWKPIVWNTDHSGSLSMLCVTKNTRTGAQEGACYLKLARFCAWAETSNGYFRKVVIVSTDWALGVVQPSPVRYIVENRGQVREVNETKILRRKTCGRWFC